MNLANLITVLRLLIAFVGFAFMFLRSWTIAFALILIAVILDIVDGKIARKRNEVTTGGIYLDVMADKIVIITTYLIIGLQVNIAFFYLGILMLIREYSIDTMRSIAAAKGTVISADKFSKIKGILFMLAMLFMLYTIAFVDVGFVLFATSSFASIVIASVGMLLAYVTLARFFITHRHLLN